MSFIFGLIILGIIIYLAMFLAQFFIMVVGMVIVAPIMGIHWVVSKFKS